MEQQIQKEKPMEQNEGARNADYINPQELRVMQITTPGRFADSWSMFSGGVMG